MGNRLGRNNRIDNSSWCSSEMEEDTFVFSWTIQNFRAFTGISQVTSSVFRGGPISNHEWRVFIEPRYKEGDVEYLAIFLELVRASNDTGRVRARFNMSIVDKCGRSKKTMDSPNVVTFSNGAASRGFRKFVRTSELFPGLLPVTSPLTIRCQIWIPGQMKMSSGNGMASPKITDRQMNLRLELSRLQSFSRSIWGLLDNEESFSDIRISTKTKVFNAHKNILCARSPIFAAMFRSDMKESILNVVEIEDFDEGAVQSLLVFVYSGSWSGCPKLAPEVLQIADKYQVVGLKEDCERVMGVNLTLDNATEYLLLARRHHALSLESTVSTFIKRFQKEVHRTESFKQITRRRSDNEAEAYF